MKHLIESKKTIAAVTMAFAFYSMGGTYAMAQETSAAPEAPAATATANPANYADEFALLNSAKSEYDTAVTDIQTAADAKDFEAYNDAVARAEKAVVKMERANSLLDKSMKKELTKQLDTIDNREKKRSHEGIMGQVNKLDKVVERAAEEGRRTEGQSPSETGRRTEQPAPRAGEKTPEMQKRYEKAEKESKKGGFMSTMGKIWDGVKTVWKAFDSIADIAVGLANMKQGLEKLKNFGKNKQGFFAKATDIAYGVKQLTWGGQSIQRGVTHLGEVKNKVFGGNESSSNSSSGRTTEDQLLDQALSGGIGL